MKSMAALITMEPVSCFQYGTACSALPQWTTATNPFNYKGMVCLESSLAMGTSGPVFFYFLDIWVRAAVDQSARPMGTGFLQQGALP